MNSKIEVFVGVDVSKDSLDVDNGRSWRVKNNGKGIARIIKTLSAQSPKLVVVESTGGYENLLRMSTRRFLPLLDYQKICRLKLRLYRESWGLDRL